MTNIVPIGAFKPEEHSIENCLTELEKYGLPRLSKMNDGGWHAKVEVFVTGKGISFDVKSDFDQKTPKDALNQCYNRLTKALNKIKEGTK